MRRNFIHEEFNVIVRTTDNRTRRNQDASEMLQGKQNQSKQKRKEKGQAIRASRFCTFANKLKKI